MGQQGPGQYPVYQQPYQPPHRTTGDMMRSLVSDTLLVLAMVVGLFLVMIGFWLLGLLDTEGGKNVGQVLASLGVFLLTVASLVGGLLRNDLDKCVRAALIIFAAVMMGWVGFWYMFF